MHRKKPGYIKKPVLQGREYSRERTRKRDSHTCQICEKVWQVRQRRFDIHHLNGLCGKLSKKYDRKEDMENLITLCHKCHMNLDEVRGKMSLGRLSTGK